MFCDFVVASNGSGGIAIRGAPIKSKQAAKLRNRAKQKAAPRASLELSNSSAKDGSLCKECGLTEADFAAHEHPDKFGEVILTRQQHERQASELAHSARQPSKAFVSKGCVFISVLYAPPAKGERSWWISTFPVQLPKPTARAFAGTALAGKDVDGAKLYERYALSGGRFRCCPTLNARLNGTDLFEVPKPTVQTLRAQASRLFSDRLLECCTAPTSTFGQRPSSSKGRAPRAAAVAAAARNQRVARRHPRLPATPPPERSS